MALARPSTVRCLQFPWATPRFYFTSYGSVSLLPLIYTPFATSARVFAWCMQWGWARWILLRPVGVDSELSPLLGAYPDSAIVVGSNSLRMKFILVLQPEASASPEFIKFANGNSLGRRDIRRERRMLNFLTRKMSIHGVTLPSVIAFNDAASTCLQVSQVECSRTGVAFKNAQTLDLHSAFEFSLSMLEQTGKKKRRRSTLYGFVERKIRQELGLDDYLRLGGSPTVDVCFAHCDLTPWNARVCGDGDFLLIDLESARLNVPPFYDFVHFWYTHQMLLLKKSESQIVEEAIGLVHAYGGEFKAHLHVAINFYFGLLYLRDKVSSDVIFELSVMGNTI